MKPQSLHAHEDRLLDFAYGELPAAEARAMEAHLQGCTRCTEALDGIRGVRATMSQLSLEPAPDAGLESLLAYAQQAARHAAEGPAPVRSRWRRWLMPAVGLAAVSFFGIISLEVMKSVDLAPSVTAKAQESEGARPELVAQKAEARDYAQAEAPAPVAPSQKLAEKLEAQQPMDDSRAGVSNAPARELKRDAASKRGGRADWNTSGSAGGFPELRSKYKSQDDEGASSVGAVQAIPPTPAARAEMQPAPTGVAPQAQAVMPPPPAESAPSADMAQAGPMADADDRAFEAPAAEAEAAKSAPPRSSLSIGSASAVRGAGAAPSMGSGASSEELEQAPSAPAPRNIAQMVPAAPRKPVPAEPEAAPREESFGVKKASRKERAAGPSASQFSQRATEAYRAGDRALEANLLRQALESGASGRERLGLLIRLCDAEFALGRRDSAIEACGLVLSEDPGSGAAQVARKRLSRESDDAEQAAPAQAAPATSAPLKR
jgi:hypothetical protein